MSKSNESCCVYTCSSVRRKNMKLMFHAFPKMGENIRFVDDNGVPEICDRRKLWENKLRMRKNASKFMKVCSLHFTDDDYECSGWSRRKKLQLTAVPSQMLPSGNNKLSERQRRFKLYQARKERLLKRTLAVKDNKTPHTCVNSANEASAAGLLLVNKLNMNPNDSVNLLQIKCEPKAEKKIMCDMSVQVDFSDLVQCKNVEIQVDTGFSN